MAALGVGVSNGPAQVLDFAGRVVGSEGGAVGDAVEVSASVRPVSSSRRKPSIGSVMASSRW
jgi:hypothetical protein